ncbi:MAG TPA: hypothetical protein VF516_03120 [Kofleriaceae bacterium]
MPFGEWSINFNGDFSGDVHFVSPTNERYIIPYEVVQAVVAERVRRAKVAFFEDADDDSLLLS